MCENEMSPSAPSGKARNSLANSLPLSHVSGHGVKNPFHQSPLSKVKRVVERHGDSVIPAFPADLGVEMAEEMKDSSKPHLENDIVQLLNTTQASPTSCRGLKKRKVSRFRAFHTPVYQKSLTAELEAHFSRVAKVSLPTPEERHTHSVTIGKQPALKRRKKTLVLDIDGTLVHAIHDHKELETQKRRVQTLEVTMNGEIEVIKLTTRPFLSTFLEDLAHLYEIIVHGPLTP